MQKNILAQQLRNRLHVENPKVAESDDDHVIQYFNKCPCCGQTIFDMKEHLDATILNVSSDDHFLYAVKWALEVKKFCAHGKDYLLDENLLAEFDYE